MLSPILIRFFTKEKAHVMKVSLFHKVPKYYRERRLGETIVMESVHNFKTSIFLKDNGKMAKRHKED